MRYKFNLVREKQRESRDADRFRIKLLGLALGSYGLLIIALFYAALQVLTMQQSLREERVRLKRIATEYQYYQASKMFVSKSDIELLDRLQNNRIFWTKKLVTLARYLPENYWITRFSFDQGALTVDGYGYISGDQRQLITLDDYLNNLRNDQSFNDVFKQIYLNYTLRSDDELRRERISFSYTAAGGK